MLAFLILITYVPEISLWLPNLMYGGGAAAAGAVGAAAFD
jgi:hypothetical protein